MKKIVFASATALLCFFTSCKDSSTSSTTGSASSDSNQANVDKNARAMKAIESGDSATIYELIAEDAVDHSGPNGMDIKGKDSVRHMLVDMHNHMKDMKFDITSSAANGDYIFTLSHATGTSTDASMGMPPGTKMDAHFVDVIKVKDGKMTEHWSYVDQNEMMKQMQSMPPMNNNGGDKKMMDKKMDTTKKM